MGEADNTEYGVADVRESRAIQAPELPYRPRLPVDRSRPIGLIGCGGISEQHLKAYAAAGLNIVAFCDIDEAQARRRQQAYYPQAALYSDFRELLRRDDVEVVDIATHPTERVDLIEHALRARKHVLSQKPFVLDLDVGERLCDLADANSVRLAVNLNGRWAPHFGYIRHAAAAGHIGECIGVHFSVHWDHNWIVGTPLESVRHIVLFDFGIHWFDMLTGLMGEQAPLRVCASTARSAGQKARPRLLGQAMVEYERAQASLVFDGDARFGPQDRTYIAGTHGSLVSIGPDLQTQSVTIHVPEGHATPKLEGTWFREGFLGTMAELCCAVEENRAPLNDARGNLRSLALCFAAVASADRQEPVVPGAVRSLPE